ncbi:MAG: glycosyltransferase family 39 protein, partial [Candidatus Nanoarchaeia archaeon]|nr:glycosyltransferase family 39 protein [Candidatus Nanoarchaeia archaeon]
DEGVYIGISKYFAGLGKVGYFEGIRPLALPFLLMPLQWIPFNSLFTGRILGMLLTIAAIPIVYYATKKVFNENSARWAMLFFSASILMLRHGSYILTDIPAYALALLACSLAIDRKYLFAGIAMGAGFLFRFPAIAVVLPILFYIVIKEKKLAKIIEFGLGMLIISIPYFVFNFFHYSGTFFGRIFGPLLEASSHIGGQAWIYGNAGILKYLISIITTDALVLIFSLTGIRELLKSKKKDYLLFASCIILFFLYFSLMIPRYEPRYMVPIIIFVFPFAGYGAYIIIKKHKKFLPWLIALIFIQGLVFSVNSALKEGTEHNSKIAELISSYSNEKIITNSALPLIYLDSKAEMLPGPNLGHTYLAYLKENKSQWLIFNPDCYPCPENDNFCIESFNKKLSYILSNNNIEDCGYLHGETTIILTKELQKISKQECLKKINYVSLPEAEKSVFIRLNEAKITEEGEIKNIEHLSIIIQEIKKNNLSHTLVLLANKTMPNNNSITFLRILNETELGIMTSKDADTFDYINKIENIASKKITSIIPRDDDWINKKIEITENIESTITGSWDTTIVPIKRKEIDIYMVKDWSNLRLHDLDYLKEMYFMLSKGDNEIGIDIPVDIITEENLKEIISFIDYISDS